jgi:GntR family transcriptional regulator
MHARQTTGGHVAELPASRIDRGSPLPFYYQLKKLLADEIEGGRWAPGDRMPSEPSICGHFAVSRTTVRQALAELESEGMIRREKGRGTFIAEPRSTSWLLQSSHGFYDEADGQGHKVTSRVLRNEVAVLPQWAADALQLAPGSKGVVLERLRCVDDALVMYVLNLLPFELLDTLAAADLENGSLYRTLEEAGGLRVFGGRRVVEAITAQDDFSTLLEVEPGAPLLFVESVSWDETMKPFECYRAWHRADRTRIEVQVAHREMVTRAGFDPTSIRLGRR